MPYDLFTEYMTGRLRQRLGVSPLLAETVAKSLLLGFLAGRGWTYAQFQGTDAQFATRPWDLVDTCLRQAVVFWP